MSEYNSTNDPKLCREMSLPFDSVDDVTKATNGFINGVEALRREFKMADVLIILSNSNLNEEGEEDPYATMVQFGDRKNGLFMAAMAFGNLKKEHDEIMSSMVHGSKEEGS